MDKRRVKKIAAKVGILLAVLVVFGGMFLISPWIGMASVGFCVLGWIAGHFDKTLRMQERFFDILLEHIEDLKDEKTLWMVYDDEDNSISVSLRDRKKKKESKEK